jgi:hypothetical protein
MLSSKLILCAENVIVDAQTNKVSIINILEDIVVESFPFYLPATTILNVLERQAYDSDIHHLTFTILLEGETLFIDEVKIKFKKNNLITRAILKLQDLSFEQGGVISFTVYSKGGEEELAKYQINLKLRNEKVVVHENIGNEKGVYTI